MIDEQGLGIFNLSSPIHFEQNKPSSDWSSSPYSSKDMTQMNINRSLHSFTVVAFFPEKGNGAAQHRLWAPRAARDPASSLTLAGACSALWLTLGIRKWHVNNSKSLLSTLSLFKCNALTLTSATMLITYLDSTHRVLR